MAEEVNVNDSLTVLDSLALYTVGGGDSIIELSLLYDDIKPNENDSQIPYFINAFIGMTTGIQTLMDAPGSGSYIVVKRLKAVCADKNILRVGYGESGGWVQKVFWGPLIFNTEATAAAYKVGSEYKFEPFKPYRLPVNTALTADLNSAGLVLITGEVIVY